MPEYGVPKAPGRVKVLEDLVKDLVDVKRVRRLE